MTRSGFHWFDLNAATEVDVKQYLPRSTSPQMALMVDTAPYGKGIRVSWLADKARRLFMRYAILLYY